MEIAYLIIGLFTGIVIGVLYSENKTDKSQPNIDTSHYVSKELYQSEKNRIENRFNVFGSSFFCIACLDFSSLILSPDRAIDFKLFLFMYFSDKSLSI